MSWGYTRDEIEKIIAICKEIDIYSDIYKQTFESLCKSIYAIKRIQDIAEQALIDGDEDAKR